MSDPSPLHYDGRHTPESRSYRTTVRHGRDPVYADERPRFRVRRPDQTVLREGLSQDAAERLARLTEANMPCYGGTCGGYTVEEMR